MSNYISIYLYLRFYFTQLVSISQAMYVHIHLHNYLSIFIKSSLNHFITNYLSIYLSFIIFPKNLSPSYLCTFGGWGTVGNTYLYIYLSIYLSLPLPYCLAKALLNLSIYRTIYLSNIPCPYCLAKTLLRVLIRIGTGDFMKKVLSATCVH